MAGIGARTNQPKVKKATVMSKHTIPKTASSGIKHQVILPKSSTVIASASSSPRQVKANGNYTVNSGAVAQSTISIKTAPRPGRVSKRNGVWYLGGNHVVKLLTSVDGDLDHSVLAKLAAVPTVVGELALSVESLVSDDITVGGFEKDLLAKITSNTLTAKRGIRSAAAPASAQPVPAPIVQNRSNAQPAAQATTPAATETNTALPAQVGEGQVPNPLLANYQPVPNPLAIRITPPASPHTAATDQHKSANAPKTRSEMPMIQAR